jgi:hypothetical protein
VGVNFRPDDFFDPAFDALKKSRANAGEARAAVSELSGLCRHVEGSRLDF